MQAFQYKALDSKSEIVASSLEAMSRQDALSKLQQVGLFAFELAEVRVSNRFRGKLRSGAVTQFYSMLHDQLEVGVPILKALEVIRNQEQSESAKQMIDDIMERVTSGSTLSDALQSHPRAFPTIDLSVIRAGEEGGFLRESLARTLQVREWQASLTSSIWGAMAYPIILVSVAAILVPGILVFLVPKFEPLFVSLRQAGKMPWATTVLLETANLAKNYGAFGILGFAIAVVTLFCSVPIAQLRSYGEKTFSQIPFLGPIARDLALARFCRVLGTLLENRIPILKAIDTSATVVGHSMLRHAIEAARDSVARGGSLVQQLAKSKQVPGDILAMLGVGEQSNTLDSVLVKIALQVETRTRKRIEFSVKLLEPAMLLVLALLVGFIVLALLLPVFEGQGLA